MLHITRSVRKFVGAFAKLRKATIISYFILQRMHSVMYIILYYIILYYIILYYIIFIILYYIILYYIILYYIILYYSTEK